MARIGEYIQDIAVKTPIIAMGVFLLSRYMIYNEIPELSQIGLAFVTVGIVGYITGMYVDKIKETSHLIIGFVSYMAYIGMTIFLKFRLNPPPIESALSTSLIFGLITAGILWLYKRY